MTQKKKLGKLKIVKQPTLIYLRWNDPIVLVVQCRKVKSAMLVKYLTRAKYLTKLIIAKTLKSNEFLSVLIFFFTLKPHKHITIVP